MRLLLHGGRQVALDSVLARWPVGCVRPQRSRERPWLDAMRGYHVRTGALVRVTADRRQVARPQRDRRSAISTDTAIILDRSRNVNHTPSATSPPAQTFRAFRPPSRVSWSKRPPPQTVSLSVPCRLSPTQPRVQRSPPKTRASRQHVTTPSRCPPIPTDSSRLRTFLKDKLYISACQVLTPLQD